MIGEDHLHIIEKGAVEHHTLMIQPQKKHYLSTQTRNFLFERYDSNQLITDARKPKYLIFSRRTPWSKISNAF